MRPDITNPAHLSAWKPAAAALIAAASTGLAGPSVNPIAWGSATTIAGDSDVVTTGTLVYAFNFGATGVAATTVNGVAFDPFQVPNTLPSFVTVANVTLAESPGSLIGYNTLGSASAPFSSLSSAYQSLLGSGGSANNPTTITVSLGGLTQGEDYLLQWWSSNAANIPGFDGETLQLTTAAASNQVQLDANVADAAGGLGQFVVGTFTAASTAQTFTLQSPLGLTGPLISGLQLRLTTPIPEASSAWALAAGGAALAACRVVRRRRRA